MVATKVALLNQRGKRGNHLQIKTSEHIWERAITYVSYTSVGNYPTTVDCNKLVDRSASDSAYQQAAALLHAEESIMMICQPTILTSATSAQDEGRDQVTRYRNQAAANIADDRTYESAKNRRVDANGMIDHTFYPTFLRPCPAMHRNPQERDKAGYSDFILSKYPDRSGQVAVLEFKPFWNYASKLLLEHYYMKAETGSIVLPNTDEFQWKLPTGAKGAAAHELLKQASS
ncbi:hypothetical protein F5050DRAFT_1716067 [Lentinula boryana]|uniref:Uncharacterized protein n=1 Tax=Lentinula boryana TaxID=40481 RepID=A0ABQ8PYD0_9AGAR|nr:hypothetical protein F5050DRAFT_1716067 [Lentinula boryana]